MGAAEFQAAARRASAAHQLNVLRVDQIATEALKRNKRRYQIVFSAADFGARLRPSPPASSLHAADATTGSDRSYLKNMPCRRWVISWSVFSCVTNSRRKE